MELLLIAWGIYGRIVGLLAQVVVGQCVMLSRLGGSTDLSVICPSTCSDMLTRMGYEG